MNTAQPDLKSQFLLNPDITYLNHGSFGACPRPVFDEYIRWQRELEYEPVQFIAVQGERYLQESREALARYVHCAADELVYVTNPSYAMNIIARSLKLQAGDEVLSTNIEYGAMDRSWNYYCQQAGARYVRQPISLPIRSKEQVLEDFWKGLSPRTRVIFISQITSSTALVLPVKEICEMAKSKGLFTIVDGAHVPGHIPLNLQELQADVYTGACHKWLLTPKGNSFLYVKKEHQHLFDPLVISWGYGNDQFMLSQFLDYHQMQGTRDFSAFLCTARAIQFLEENNWPAVAAGCRQLVQNNYERFCELLGTAPICPVGDEFLGQMCSSPIHCSEPEKLQRCLFEQYRIEVPVMRQADAVYLRFSVQAYNSQEDINRLAEALAALKKEGSLLR